MFAQKRKNLFKCVLVATAKIYTHTYTNTECKTRNKESNDQFCIISCENPFEEIIGWCFYCIQRNYVLKKKEKNCYTLFIESSILQTTRPSTELYFFLDCVLMCHLRSDRVFI